jgi:hypothetical protein
VRKTLLISVMVLALIATSVATASGSKPKPPSATGTTSTSSSTTPSKPAPGEPAPGTASNTPVIPARTRMELFLPQPVSDGDWASFKLVITPGVGVHLSNVNVAFLYTNHYGGTDVSKNDGWIKLHNVSINGQSPRYNDPNGNYLLVTSLREGHPVTITGQVQVPKRQVVNGMFNRWFYMRAYAYTTSPATDSLNWSMWSNNAYQIYAGS